MKRRWRIGLAIVGGLVIHGAGGGFDQGRLLALDQGGHLLLSHHAELRKQIAEFLQPEVQTRR